MIQQIQNRRLSLFSSIVTQGRSAGAGNGCKQ
ncbi:hypothetical protein PVAP13_5KG748500 [Panicum virgatum]|uniref:Uncharacterized protein n=1 Tax=Panicum virgatum TaxID=38727 RepID=A0A8T0SWA3_PANVG|nr:hypothetical protein PVAP13_5KG748500 [Panicum virgatum]